MEARRHFARIVARFEREAGYQKRSPAGQQYNAGYGLKLTASNEMDLKAHESLRRSQRQFDNLERALYDPHTRAVVEEVCCNDREVGSLEIPTLRIGLTALADHLKFPGKMESSCVDIPARRRRDRGKSSRFREDGSGL